MGSSLHFEATQPLSCQPNELRLHLCYYSTEIAERLAISDQRSAISTQDAPIGLFRWLAHTAVAPSSAGGPSASPPEMFASHLSRLPVGNVARHSLF